jgi:hypothetical protein
MIANVVAMLTATALRLRPAAPALKAGVAPNAHRLKFAPAALS